MCIVMCSFCFFLMLRPPPRSTRPATLLPYTTLFRSFPLFLMPQTGIAALKGYVTCFFYLGAWGPLYVILHMICMTRATSAANGVAGGGVTLGSYAGIGAVNAATATIAGIMLLGVPFLAAGWARGAL